MKLTQAVITFVLLVLLMGLAVACAPSPTPAPSTATQSAPATVAPAKVEASPTVAAKATASPTAPKPAEPKKGGRLVFGMSWEPAGFDPHVTSSNEGGILGRMIFDSLVRQDLDSKIHPGLATEWKVSDDGKTYTFQLRRDVTFHDGSKLDAKAVKFSLDRIANPATKSEYAITLLGPYKSTEIVDEYTVKVNLNDRFGPLLSGLAQPYVAIVSPGAVEQWGDKFVDHMIGTGPFIFKEWVRKDHITVTRNPAYNWGPPFSAHTGAPYVDEVLIKFVTEGGVRVGTLETGETHLINDVTPLDYKRLSSNKAFTVYTLVQPGSPLGIGLNVTRPPFDDLKVRQAMLYAIDNKAIVETLFAGLYPISQGPLAPNTLGYWKGAEEMYGYNPAKAKALLDEAGWKLNPSTGLREKGGQQFKIYWPTFTFQRMNEMATIVQAQLKEIGIELKVDVMAFPSLYKTANNCEHNMAHFGFSGVDPDQLSVVFYSKNVGSGWAWTCAKDPQIDELLQRGSASNDDKQRAAAYVELQKLIMDKALIVPIRQWTQLWGARAEVKGLQFDILGKVPLLNDVSLEK